MNISSSTASSSLQLAALQQQSPVNSSERPGRERGNDGDQDNGNSAAAVKAAAPTVNLNGQAVGTRISVTA